MKCLYLTAADVGAETGEGMVTKHECGALTRFGGATQVLDRKYIDPAVYKQPDSPFLLDYFAALRVGRHDLCHIYGGPYPVTVDKLKRAGCTVSITIPAHDRKVSIAEHERMYGSYPFHQVSDPYLWGLHIQYMNRVDSIVCPSKMSKRVLESEGVETPITVIPHGTEIPDHITPPPEKFTVGYLGVIGPDKGLSYLIKAWSQLDYPDAELVFAGSGTDQLKPAIQQLAGKGKFRLLGRIDNIRALFDQCSVYVQPSLNEGFGITALEAMAHGRPVIVSDGAGSADCVGDGDGFVVPAGDVDAIASEINWFMENQDRIEPMGKCARVTAKEYSWDTIRRDYVEYFNRLVQTSS